MVSGRRRRPPSCGRCAAPSPSARGNRGPRPGTGSAPGRDELPGRRSGDRLPPRARSGRAGRPGASSQDRRPPLAGPRRSRPSAGRGRVPRSKLASPPAGRSLVRCGLSPRKVRAPGPPPEPAPDGRPVGRWSSVADGRTAGTAGTVTGRRTCGTGLPVACGRTRASAISIAIRGPAGTAGSRRPRGDGRYGGDRHRSTDVRYGASSRLRADASLGDLHRHPRTGQYGSFCQPQGDVLLGGTLPCHVGQNRGRDLAPMTGAAYRWPGAARRVESYHPPHHHGPHQHEAQRRGQDANPARLGWFAVLACPTWGQPDRGQRSPTRCFRLAVGSTAEPSPRRRPGGPSSVCRRQSGCRSYGHRCLRRWPWAFRVPQPRQPTSSICLPQYPDKRRGPLNLIGSDPLQACPAVSYSPTRSPAQYHRR